jgi:hypothetical protein
MPHFPRFFLGLATEQTSAPLRNPVQKFDSAEEQGYFGD